MARYRKKVIAYQNTITAGTDSKVSIYTVEDAHVRLTRLAFAAASGALGYLFVSLYYGDQKIVPEEGELTSDNFPHYVWTDWEFHRGDDVVVRFRNTSVNDLFVQLILEFEVMGED